MEEALSKHDHATIRRLLLKDKKKTELRHRYFNGQSALHVACDYGDLETVKILLKHKFSVDDADQSNQNALHVACKQGHLEIVSLIIENDANVSATSFQGNTPLHFLVGHKPTSENLLNFYTVFEKMKKAGAYLNVRNSQGETPLHCAGLKGCEKNAMWLIREGADVDIRNRKGETILHYAARFGSKEFITLLISVGASPNISGTVGSPRDYAVKAGRDDIVQLFDESASTTTIQSNNSIIINGSELTSVALSNYKILLSKPEETSENKTRNSPSLGNRSPSLGNRSRSSSKEEHITYNRKQVLQVIDINDVLFQKQKLVKLWRGIISILGPDKKWKEESCYIEKNQIRFVNNELKPISLDGATSIRVYSSSNSRFSILYYSTVDEITKDFSAKTQLLPEILATIVENTRKPIEFIDDYTLISILESLEPEEKLRDILSKKPKRKRFSSSTSVKLLRPSFQKKRGSITAVFDTIVDEKGTIYSSADFSSDTYSKIFSPDLRVEEVNQKFVLMSGNVEDILHYVILHSGLELFKNACDVKAFYLGYYVHSDPSDILFTIENVWNIHSKVDWAHPYNEISPEMHLFSFLKGFIESPFVLVDRKVEMKFRSDLADLFAKLAVHENENIAILYGVVQTVKKARMQASITQCCDLNSLLGSSSKGSNSEEDCFDIHAFDAHDIAEQIICINSDLYGQLQISELLNLRYQKDKALGKSLNKVTEFSKKLCLYVTTTILQYDDPKMQKATKKKWINIAENLFHYRDYNSAVQIIHGMTEISVQRLKHLHEGLSFPKWTERITKLKEVFDPKHNYANYRKLIKDPPCIPYLGVGLNDLVHCYEENPDEISDAINFQKMRAIADIIRSLRVEETQHTIYPSFKLDTQIAQALLNISPMNSEELSERSTTISELLYEHCVDNTALVKENEQLKQELNDLRKENETQDELIETLKFQIQQNSAKLKASTTQSPNVQ